MTQLVDIVNESLQKIGARTTVSATELTNLSSNEAIQANLVIDQIRRRLIRMAPWNFARNAANLTLITATPGTPENQSQATNAWQKGQPAPPWAYEYQWPIDCIKGLYVIPQFTTGFASGVPITTAVTGGAPTYWNGPPVRYQPAVDQFFPVTSAAIVSGGTGHAVGDILTLASGPVTNPPIGAPVQLLVGTVGGGGVITGISVVNVISGETSGGASPVGGSYFAIQSNPVAQGSSTGVGTGATFNLTFGAQGDQRVILTNQENAALIYARNITDPNVMDESFQDAWSSVLGSRLIMALTGDKALANLKINEANAIIVEARKNDGNDGLTVNNVTPDFIRIRGIYFDTDMGWTPQMGIDWGALFPLY